MSEEPRKLLDASDERLRADYDFEAEFDPQAVAARIEQAREFIREARQYVAPSRD